MDSRNFKAPFDTLLQFYRQFQSSYQDFTAARSCVYLWQANVGSGMSPEEVKVIEAEHKEFIEETKCQ